MFAKSEESLGSSSGIGSIKRSFSLGSIKNESNEENSPRLIPIQFNCENRTGRKTSAFGTVAISVFLCSLTIAQNNENFVFCFTDKARKIKKQLCKYRSCARILGSFALTIMTHNCASRIR